MRIPATLLSVATCTALLAAAPQDLSGRIDAFIQGEMKRLNIPGISLAVVTNNQPPLVKSYGLANIEHQVPVRPETIFQSGSVGKQFTSAAVMLLVEDGKVALDELVGKHLGAVHRTRGARSPFAICSHTPAGSRTIRKDSIFVATTPTTSCSRSFRACRSRSNPASSYPYSNSRLRDARHSDRQGHGQVSTASCSRNASSNRST